METARSPLNVTLSVWKALVLREAVHRLFQRRAAWLWLVLEPVVHFAAMAFIFAAVRVRVIGGIDTVTWVLSGILVFFIFKRTAVQAKSAIDANEALFAYRQVKPVDTVLARAVLEGFLSVIITLLVLGAAWTMGYLATPADPLTVIGAFAGMWGFGLGWGLVTSVLGTLVRELGKVLDMVHTPLYFASGVLIPLSLLQTPYREILMLNPLAHGVDAVRLGFAPYYYAATEQSLAYLYAWALVFIFFGLALHVRFATRLATR